MRGKLDDESLDTIFRQARTYNGYLETSVTEADCVAIWDLMKMGPTSANQLPARLIWCRSGEAKARLAACATGSNAAKIQAAPVSVVIGMDLEFHAHLPDLFPHVDARAMFVDRPELRRTSAFRNSSLQGAYFIVAARALGFDTGPMSGFDAAAVEAEFFLTAPNVRVNFISTLGYGDPASIFPRLPRPGFERFNRFA